MNMTGIIAAISDRQKEIAGISKEFSIGGFSGPSVTQGTGGPKPVNNLAELEAKALQKIEDQKIEIMRQGYERERAEAALRFGREKERINTEERQRLELYDRLKEAGERLDRRSGMIYPHRQPSSARRQPLYMTRR